MSTLDADQTLRLSPDERYELAARASATERRNRPMALLMLGIAATILMTAVLGWALLRKSTSAERLQRTRNELKMIVTEIAAIDQLQTDASASGDAGLYRPIPSLLSDIQRLSEEAGLDNVSIPRESADNVRGFTRNKYAYTEVKDESLERLLEWVRLVRDQIDGMRVFSIKINPDRRDTLWNMDVTFTRLEQTG